MKLRLEISDQAEEEVIIRCQSLTEEVKLIQDVVSNVIEKDAELLLTMGSSEYYIPRSELLFFETDNGRTTAHTADNMYYTHYKLYELERILPAGFVRVSKSCILNAAKVCAIQKNLAGSSGVLFRDSRKKVYVSRMYYKVLKEKIEEMRSLT